MKRVIKTIISILTVSILISLFVSCNNSSENTYLTEPPNKEKFEKVKKDLNDYFDKYYGDSFSGSILIASYGEVLFTKGYGMADYENKIPNTPDTAFNISSLTQQFTSMGIMILSDKGLLGINDSFGKYIPGIDHGDEITIQQLLSQTSGIDDSIYEQGIFDNMDRGDTIAEIIKSLKGKKFKLGDQPGKFFYDCNINYFLLGYIIEKLSGQSYENFIEQNIFKPLEMNNSGYYHNTLSNENYAVGYSVIDPEPVKADVNDIKYTYPAVGMYSSVEDLYKWDQALYTDKLIKKETLDKIFERHINGYSFGWHMADDKDCIISQIEGMGNGTNTFIIRYIGKNQLIVLLSNEGGGIKVSPIPYIERVFKELE